MGYAISVTRRGAAFAGDGLLEWISCQRYDEHSPAILNPKPRMSLGLISSGVSTKECAPNLAIMNMTTDCDVVCSIVPTQQMEEPMKMAGRLPKPSEM